MTEGTAIAPWNGPNKEPPPQKKTNNLSVGALGAIWRECRVGGLCADVDDGRVTVVLGRTESDVRVDGQIDHRRQERRRELSRPRTVQLAATHVAETSIHRVSKKRQ